MATATQVGNDVLSKPCKIVASNEFGADKLKTLIETMRNVNDEMRGVGIAANQVGDSKCVCIVHVRPTVLRPEREDLGEIVMINPKVTNKAGESADWEGCLSVAEAGLFAKVSRAENITVEWQDLTGKVRQENLTGLQARVAQHEIAHLEGRVFLQESGVDLDTLHSRSEYIKMRKEG